KELARFDGFNTDVLALAFAPNGKRLSAGLRDGTILTYDVGKFDTMHLPPRPLGELELESCWSALSADDANKGHLGMWSLVATPKQSVAFLRARQKPVKRMDPESTGQWIADLDSETFAVRQSAQNALERSGEQIKHTIQKALKGNIPVES